LILRAPRSVRSGYWLSSYLDFKGLELNLGAVRAADSLHIPFFVMLFGAVFFRQPIKLKSLPPSPSAMRGCCCCSCATFRCWAMTLRSAPAS